MSAPTSPPQAEFLFQKEVNMSSAQEVLPKGVIFDMDGVLVDTEQIVYRAASRLFQQMAVTVDPRDFPAFAGVGEEIFIAGLAKKYNVNIDARKGKEKLYDIYLETIKGNLKPLPGVFEFIEKCKASGKKIALASSADMRKVKGNLHEINLPFDTFDAIVVGEDILNKKPSPDVFIHAAKLIGLKPSQCLVIEDAIAGLEAAKAAGAKCLAITTSFTHEQLKDADFIAADLSEVPLGALDWAL